MSENFYPKDSTENTKDVPYLIKPVLEDGNKLSLIDSLLIMSRHLKTIIYTPLILCILAVIYVLFIAEPVYIATAKIIPTGGGDAISEMRGLAAQFGINIPSGSNEVDLSSAEMFQEIIKSRTLARSLLDRKFDTEKYGPQKSLLQILTYNDDNQEFGLDTLQKMAVKTLIEEIINAFKDRNTSVLTIEVGIFEPQFAADLNNAVIEELDRLQKSFKLDHVSEKREFIEGRIIDIKLELEAAEEILKDFRDQNRQIQNSPGLLLEQERLMREVEVQTGVFITLKQQLEMAKIEEVQQSSVIQVLDRPEAPLKRDKPKRTITVIMTGIVGILFGVLFTFVNEYFQSGSAKEKEKLSYFQKIFLQNLRGLWIRKKPNNL